MIQSNPLVFKGIIAKLGTLKGLSAMHFSVIRSCRLKIAAGSIHLRNSNSINLHFRFIFWVVLELTGFDVAGSGSSSQTETSGRYEVQPFMIFHGGRI